MTSNQTKCGIIYKKIVMRMGDDEQSTNHECPIFKYLLRMWLAFWCSIPHMFLYYNFFCTCFRIRHNAYKRYFLVTGYFNPKFSINFCSSLNSVSYGLMTACFLYDGAFCLIFFPELFFSFLKFFEVVLLFCEIFCVIKEVQNVCLLSLLILHKLVFISWCFMHSLFGAILCKNISFQLHYVIKFYSCLFFVGLFSWNSR